MEYLLHSWKNQMDGIPSEGAAWSQSSQPSGQAEQTRTSETSHSYPVPGWG